MLQQMVHLQPRSTAFGTKACHLTNDRCVLPSSRTGLCNKHGARRFAFTRSRSESHCSEAWTNIHGKSRYYSDEVVQRASVWKGKKTWNHTAGAKGAGVEEQANNLLSSPGPNREVHRTRTGFTRLPVLDRPDYFGRDRRRGKYTERVCSAKRREGARGEERVESGLVECGSRSSERGLLHRARGSTVT